jgi:hypothetical protein
MAATRRACAYLAIADVVLFLIAAAFNDHSTTSVDGIVWWIAIFGFLLLIVAGFVVIVQFLLSRGNRPRRARPR